MKTTDNTMRDRVQKLVKTHIQRHWRKGQPPFPVDYFADELVEEIIFFLHKERDIAWEALEDTVHTLEAMNFHINNPLYERLCNILNKKGD